MASIYDYISNKGVVRYRLNKRFIGKKDVPANVLEVLTADNMVDENGLIIVDKKSEELNSLDPADVKKLDKKEKAPAAEGDGTDPDEDGEDGEATEPDLTPDLTEDDDSDEEDEEEKTTDPDEDGDEPDQKAEQKAATPKPTTKATRRPKKAEKFVSKVPQSRPGMAFPRVNGKTVDVFDGETPHTHIKLVGGYPVPLSAENFNSRTEKEIEEKLVELGMPLLNFTREDGTPGTNFNADLDEDGDGLSDDTV